VIIISLVWFLLVKKIKLKFYKIHKIKPKPVQTNQFEFGYFILKTKIQLIGFGSIQIDFGAVRFGSVINIKNQKLYYYFLGFLDFLMGLVSVWFFYFSVWLGSVFQFQVVNHFNPIA
jgi:hypothetical protein